MNWLDFRGNSVTHRIERCQFVGNRVNDSSAMREVGAAALFLYGVGAARQTCVRDDPPIQMPHAAGKISSTHCSVVKVGHDVPC